MSTESVSFDDVIAKVRDLSVRADENHKFIRAALERLDENQQIQQEQMGLMVQAIAIIQADIVRIER